MRRGLVSWEVPGGVLPEGMGARTLPTPRAPLPWLWHPIEQTSRRQCLPEFREPLQPIVEPEEGSGDPDLQLVSQKHRRQPGR